MQPIYSLSVAATKIDAVTPPPVTTLRSWIDQYGAFLSEHAAPQDRRPGQERRLTDQDIAVLRLVAELRREGKRRGDIEARLKETKPQVGEIIVADPEELPPQAPQQPAEGLQLPALVVDAVNQRVDALGRDFDSLRGVVDRLERNQRDRAMIFVAGVAVGLVAGILLLLAAYLLANIGA